LAERIHTALVELSDGSSVFTGCDESGVPLKGNSQVLGRHHASPWRRSKWRANRHRLHGASQLCAHCEPNIRTKCNRI